MCVQRHDELSRALLNGDTGSSDWRRQRLRPTADRAQQLQQDRNALQDDGVHDEILDGLVKAATVKATAEPKETRRRARQFNRKSCKLPVSR